MQNWWREDEEESRTNMVRYKAMKKDMKLATPLAKIDNFQRMDDELRDKSGDKKLCRFIKVRERKVETWIK